jgi:glycosyltransferase involved in cell wall biosynthesis
MKVVFIVPMFNAAPHVGELIKSLQEQTNPNWEAILIDDISEDDTIFMANHCSGNDERITVISNKEKKWALKNVVDNARNVNLNDIIAVLDGDDALCNEKTVDLILNEYQDDDVGTVWTGHKWDINNINISKELPDNPPVNPYEYPWVTSHLKTFRASLIHDIHDDNFKDMYGNWFKRGYDQALYLPLLYLSKKRKYIDEVCYLYRINSNSMKHREWKEQDQLNTVKLVRSRGFIK